MKTKLFTIIAVIGMLVIGLASCSELDEIGHAMFHSDEVYVVNGKPDTDMKCVMLTVYTASYDKDAESVTRAYAELLISGYHEKPYACTYTIDGKEGVGNLSIHKLPKGDAGTDLRTGTFQGNFPSGTPLDQPCYRASNRTLQYHGMSRFLMPMLEPGDHTITITITNEYGQTQSDTKTCVVADKK